MGKNMPSPEEVLDKLPKKTPVWAVGVVTVIVSFTVSFISLYVFLRPEVQQYLSASIDERKITLTSVLTLLAENQKQVTDLSISNRSLTDRVTTIERELAKSQKDLESCEFKLQLCKKGK